MIEIANLKKSFGVTRVLDGVSLRIPDGEVFGLVGVSGAGKSTLLRCINGLEPFEEGSISVDGCSVGDLNARELNAFRAKIGIIFQQYSLLERKTVAQNIDFALKCHNVLKRGKIVYDGSADALFLEQADVLDDIAGEAGGRAPHSGERAYVLVQTSAAEDALSRLALAFDKPFRVLWGGLDRYRDQVKGSFTVAVSSSFGHFSSRHLPASPWPSSWCSAIRRVCAPVPSSTTWWTPW